MFQFVVSRNLKPSASIVTDDHEKQFYWDVLSRYWGTTASSSSFPGMNVCSISRKHLNAKIRRGRYLMALKSDGVRYLLLLTTRRGNDTEPVALMIDRVGTMYEIMVAASDEYFALGTVLEGELVARQPANDVMMFLLFDCIFYKGKRLTNLPFEDRLGYAHACCRYATELSAIEDDDEMNAKILETDSIVIVHAHPVIVAHTKQFVERSYAARLWSDRNDANHRVDGLILMDADAPYEERLAKRAFKWKPYITIDLEPTKTAALLCAQGDVRQLAPEWTFAVRESRITAESGILEYAISVEGSVVTLFAIRARDDKLKPNSIAVVRSSIEESIERMTPEELGT